MHKMYSQTQYLKKEKILMLVILANYAIKNWKSTEFTELGSCKPLVIIFSLTDEHLLLLTLLSKDTLI